LQNFQTGQDRFRFSRAVIHALGMVKWCAAEANRELGEFDAGPSHLSSEQVDAIATAAREVMDGKWDDEFPLSVFQSGSGTQTHMNANEVIATRATQLLGNANAAATAVHPNDHVNLGQSSNDVIPTVMHVATLTELRRTLLPAVQRLAEAFEVHCREQAGVVMVGRTHLQDATPITLGQVISGWVAQLELACASIESRMPALCQLAIGGTAVGTGINAHPRFAEQVAARLAQATGEALAPAENKFAALSGHEAMAETSAALRTLAGVLLKVTNDLRWYASGPRAGLGELELPANEPGSSIMPGKVNPTQCESLAMVALHVYGNDHAVAFAASQGNFQLNVYKPLILHNVLESVSLLATACDAFRVHCVAGLRPNLLRIQEHLDDSLMLATALTRAIGYDQAAEIARCAHRERISLRDAALRAGVPSELYDRCIGDALRQLAEAGDRQLRGS
jgi:fumarate hydratase class II